MKTRNTVTSGLILCALLASAGFSLAMSDQDYLTNINVNTEKPADNTPQTLPEETNHPFLSKLNVLRFFKHHDAQQTLSNNNASVQQKAQETETANPVSPPSNMTPDPNTDNTKPSLNLEEDSDAPSDDSSSQKPDNSPNNMP